MNFATERRTTKIAEDRKKVQRCLKTWTSIFLFGVLRALAGPDEAVVLADPC